MRELTPEEKAIIDKVRAAKEATGQNKPTTQRSAHTGFAEKVSLDVETTFEHELRDLFKNDASYCYVPMWHVTDMYLRIQKADDKYAKFWKYNKIKAFVRQYLIEENINWEEKIVTSRNPMLARFPKFKGKPDVRKKVYGWGKIDRFDFNTDTETFPAMGCYRRVSTRGLMKELNDASDAYSRVPIIEPSSDRYE